MRSWVLICMSVAAASASVLPPYGGAAWPDYGHGYHHPVATSYANVWKVDHSVPVVVKPVVAPVVKTYPAYGFAAWDTLPYGHSPLPYGHSNLPYGHQQLPYGHY